MGDQVQAFPSFGKFQRAGDIEIADGNPGMTLRDYFAAQYLTGAISIGNIGFNETAKRAYEMADLMIAERGKDET